MNTTRRKYRAPRQTAEEMAAAEARANEYGRKLAALMVDRTATQADWDALYLEMGK